MSKNSKTLCRESWPTRCPPSPSLAPPHICLPLLPAALPDPHRVTCPCEASAGAPYCPPRVRPDIRSDGGPGNPQQPPREPWSRSAPREQGLPVSGLCLLSVPRAGPDSQTTVSTCPFKQTVNNSIGHHPTVSPVPGTPRGLSQPFR